MNNEDEVAILLSVQRALLGMVTPSLRAVSATVDSIKNEVSYFFFYDGQITEEQRDLASCVINESSADFFDYMVNSHIIRLDYPQKIPFQGRVAYLRKE